MKKTFLFISLLFLSLGICQQTLAQERYQATWESLSTGSVFSKNYPSENAVVYKIIFKK